MARRIKEEPDVHRKRIADAAGVLFEEKGTENISMEEIAKKAGYSKATLYVYFQNKDEIVGYLVLSSMIKLKEYISAALAGEEDFFEKYLNICQAMVLYEAEYPFYFSLVLDYINIDFKNSRCEESERETFYVGEEINRLLLLFFEEGIEKGAFHAQINIKAVIFAIWGMVSGLIELSVKKEQYIGREMHLTKKEFLEEGFRFLYRAIEKK